MAWFDENSPTNTGFSGGMDKTGGFQTVPSVGTGQAGLPRDPGTGSTLPAPDGYYAWRDVNTGQIHYTPNGQMHLMGGSSPDGASPVNQNPLFNPNTNITPGMDIPLAGGTAPAATPAAPTAGAPTNFDAAWLDTIFPGETLSSEMLLAKEAELGKLGVKVLRNAEGRAGKIQLPNGQIVDVVQGGGTGLNRKQWLTGDASGGASGGSLGSLGQGFGGLTAPFTGQFSAPSAADAQAQPGFQFALDKGLNAVDRGAASKGTLLTGGNVKDRIDYATGMASQNYNNVFNQSLATFGTNRDTFYHNQDSPYNKYLNLAQLGKPTTP